MASPIKQLADKLATRSSRRGFMRVAAKVTTAVAGVGGGLSRIYNAAATYPDHCCNLLYYKCTTCPNCPSGPSNAYYWGCCYGRCLWACVECYSDLCSCAYNTYNNCGGQSCPYAPGQEAAK